MAVTEFCGFEAGSPLAEQVRAVSATITLTGSAAYSSTQARTGVSSVRCNVGSGASGTINISAGYLHFGVYIATMPSVARMIVGVSGAGTNNVLLNTDGTLSFRVASSVIGTSIAVLSTNTWYWIGVRNQASVTGVLLQIDGVDQLSGTSGSSAGLKLGVTGTEASAIDLYIDDFINDDAGFLASSRVALLLPTADNAGGVGWRLGTNAALGGNGFAAVDNTPPLGVADLAVGSDPKQIRNATSNANDSFDATMTTYAAAGVAAADTVLAILPSTHTAAPVTTSAKSGTVGVASNPTIANVALKTDGLFWSGVTAGTWPTGWKASVGTLTLSPSVTVGTAPVMRITQVTSSTRIAMVCFMAMSVAWTPAAAAQVPYTNPMPPLIAQ
jgi:hypothetical protein